MTPIKKLFCALNLLALTALSKASSLEELHDRPCTFTEKYFYMFTEGGSSIRHLNREQRIELLKTIITQEDTNNTKTFQTLRALFCSIKPSTHSPDEIKNYNFFQDTEYLSCHEKPAHDSEAYQLLKLALRYCAINLIKLLYTNITPVETLWQFTCDTGERGHINYETYEWPILDTGYLLYDLELLISQQANAQCYDKMLELLMQLRFLRQDFTLPDFCERELKPDACAYISDVITKYNQTREKQQENNHQSLFLELNNNKDL